jgi:hypothetical protein
MAVRLRSAALGAIAGVLGAFALAGAPAQARAGDLHGDQHEHRVLAPSGSNLYVGGRTFSSMRTKSAAALSPWITPPARLGRNPSC